MWFQVVITIRIVSACASACTGASGDDDDGRDDRNLKRFLEATSHRCLSIDTNRSQIYKPRYICRRCRRALTQGGLLRNFPVGGRKRNVARRPRVVVSRVFPRAVPLSALIIASNNYQMGLAARRLGGVPPRAVEEHLSFNRRGRRSSFVRPANVPPPPPPPQPQPQTEDDSINPSENEDDSPNNIIESID